MAVGVVGGAHVGVSHGNLPKHAAPIQPHPEGLAEPLDYVTTLRREHLDDAAIRRIMSDNGNALLGFGVAA
jgi:hypothetical protein